MHQVAPALRERVGIRMAAADEDDVDGAGCQCAGSERVADVVW